MYIKVVIYIMAQGKFEDLTGRTFGRLTVLYRAPDRILNSGSHVIMWHCVCSCDNHTEKDYRAYMLKSGRTNSCGCLQKELARQRRITGNIYDLSGEYGIGHTSKKEEFYFDLEDYVKICSLTWYIDPDGYVEAKLRNGSGKHVKMHNIIMGQKYIDHIGGPTTRNDNRKINLRATNDDGLSFESRNNMNKDLQKNNTSGVAGVHWHSRDNIWECYISINKKRLYLGRYEDFDDAVKARKAAEEKYFKDWSRDNSIEYSLKNNILDDFIES